MSPPSATHLLHQLAHLYGVQTAYYDISHQRQPASVESLLAVLKALGAPVATLQDVPSAWRERRQTSWQRLLEPVTVSREEEAPLINVQLPSNTADITLNCNLKLENGEQRRWECHSTNLPVIRTAEVEGTQYLVKQLPLPGRLPPGYHQLTLELPGRQAEALIIAAPLKAYTPPNKGNSQGWGVFLPLYALSTQNSWGSGDFSDMEALMMWASRTGAKVIATLPLLPIFTDETSEPSPYLPVSRLLWNEFYLDIKSIPELQRCPSAQAILASSSFQQEIKAQQNAPLVDYHRQMALKRRLLEELCSCLFSRPSDRLDSLHRFAQANPLVTDYARFRATGEKQRTPWQSWPQHLQEGIIKEGDYHEASRRYHLYAQWLAHQQMQALIEKARKTGLQMYLDLPLGVHPDGYDVWRERNVFALNATAGAPPDAVFTKGQDWLFPPLHPEKTREQGYRYTIAYLRHHLQQAGILRIDHIMGLHRLFWIPKGMNASQGVYVRYRAEELYAILALESHRHRTIIVGEDLGTVPPQVRPAMARHGLHRMYVLQYELVTDRRAALRPVPRNSVASLNTHDMPPFAAFWQGLDIEERRQLGLLDQAGAEKEIRTRRAIRQALTAYLRHRGLLAKSAVDELSVLRACLAFLSASQSRAVLVNLEDLWLETKSQNMPGIHEEYPSWRRKARYGLESFCQMPQVLDTLQIIYNVRK